MEYGDLFRLDGRTALVVGAGSGIGAAVAEGLAAFGAQVHCADARFDAAEATAKALGGPAVALALDLLDPAAVEDAARSLPAPDILVTTRR
jgi:NAD(P)-dependent dehydrogenase (short-subunit alcohol dehydrogenase family)